MTARTGQTDDERILDLNVLPPPEHLIRFFPIKNTPIETLISQTRTAVHRIMRGQDDRLLLIIGPCSIHDRRRPSIMRTAWRHCAASMRGRWKS